MNIIIAKMWELGEFDLVQRIITVAADPDIDPVYARLRDHVSEIERLLRYDPNLYTNILYGARDMAAKLRNIELTFDIDVVDSECVLAASCPPLLTAVIQLAKASPHPYLQPVLPPATTSEVRNWVRREFANPLYRREGHVDILIPYHVFTVTTAAQIAAIPIPKFSVPVPQVAQPLPEPIPIYYIHNTYEGTNFRTWGEARFCAGPPRPAEFAAEINTAGPPRLMTFPQLLQHHKLTRM